MAKVLLSIPEPILKQVDKKAKLNHLSRSEAARIACMNAGGNSFIITPPFSPSPICVTS